MRRQNIVNPLDHQHPELNGCVIVIHSDTAIALNPVLLEGFEKFADDPATRKSHLFNGRYENVYMEKGDVTIFYRLLYTAGPDSDTQFDARPAPRFHR
jgi:hypothetical protein